MTVSALIAEIARLSGTAYGKDTKADVAMRVVADHLRAISFAIAESVTGFATWAVS